MLHPEDRAASAEIFARIAAGEVGVDDAVRRYVRRDGGLIYTRRVAVALREPDGRVQCVLVQLEDVTGERLARAELRQRAARDPLTGLATGESLADELEVSGAARSLLVVAIRELSRVNGALGRRCGDQLLVAVAERLRGCCRDGDVVARLGGADFAILLDDGDRGSVSALAGRVTAALRAPFVLGDRTVRLAFNIGTAADPAGSQSLAALLHHADLAVQANTSSAAEEWTGFDPAMIDSSARAFTIESDLKAAVDRAELTLAYQPIVDVAAGTVRAVEALSRWRHPHLGEVSPAEFIPAAERIGVIAELTRWVLDTSCTDLARWRRDYPAAAELRVTVNVPPRCLSAVGFPEIVAECLTRASVPADRLILEITESALSLADATAVDNAKALRRMGLGLAIDDFGVGESSLARLARFPMTHLKLDRSFLDGVTGPEQEAPLVRATIAMAAELGLTLIAEGVETEQQLDLLRRYQCPQAQGYLLARPQPGTAIEPLLAACTIDRARP
jgi:diguanylate cyclase (GGDEF)-like protein